MICGRVSGSESTGPAVRLHGHLLPSVFYRSVVDAAGAARPAGGTHGQPVVSTTPDRVELDHHLRDMRMPSGTMDLSTLEGFLVALIVGPGTPPTEDWLPKVWGGRRRRRASARVRFPRGYARFLELVLQYHAELAGQLANSPESFQPMFSEAQFGGVPATIVDPWCSGFVAGMTLNARAWRCLQKECPDLLRPILRYGTRDGWELRHQEPDPAASHAEWWPQFGCAVHGIYRYWRAKSHLSER